MQHRLLKRCRLSAIEELWRTAAAESCGLSLGEFSAALISIGEKVNHGQPPGSMADAAEQISFFRSLHLNELALAQACALAARPRGRSFSPDTAVPSPRPPISIHRLRFARA